MAHVSTSSDHLRPVFSSCVLTLCRGPPRTSGRSVLARRASATRAPPSTASSLTSCVRSVRRELVFSILFRVTTQSARTFCPITLSPIILSGYVLTPFNLSGPCDSLGPRTTPNNHCLVVPTPDSTSGGYVGYYWVVITDIFRWNSYVWSFTDLPGVCSLYVFGDVDHSFCVDCEQYKSADWGTCYWFIYTLFERTASHVVSCAGRIWQ